jgi:hypothetical protein
LGVEQYSTCAALFSASDRHSCGKDMLDAWPQPWLFLPLPLDSYETSRFQLLERARSFMPRDIPSGSNEVLLATKVRALLPMPDATGSISLRTTAAYNYGMQI